MSTPRFVELLVKRSKAGLIEVTLKGFFVAVGKDKRQA